MVVCMVGFKVGVGIVLFFEDQDVVKGMQEKFVFYVDWYVFFFYLIFLYEIFVNV